MPIHCSFADSLQSDKICMNFVTTVMKHALQVKSPESLLEGLVYKSGSESVSVYTDY